MGSFLQKELFIYDIAYNMRTELSGERPLRGKERAACRIAGISCLASQIPLTLTLSQREREQLKPGPESPSAPRAPTGCRCFCLPRPCAQERGGPELPNSKRQDFCKRLAESRNKDAREERRESWPTTEARGRNGQLRKVLGQAADSGAADSRIAGGFSGKVSIFETVERIKKGGNLY
jgi:hypothetical protein